MYIDINTLVNNIQTFLDKLDFLEIGEKILDVEKPGEGNMNVVLRVKTNRRSFIVKQSRPFVQKYQDIDAPLDRIDVEHTFYKAVSGNLIDDHIPKTLGYYKQENTLLLEDLGECVDMSLIYKTRSISSEQLDVLVKVLAAIHASNVNTSYPENKELRLLNHQHIFVLPFLEDNGFSLDTVQPGLAELSMKYRKDKNLKKQIKNIGAQYLKEGTILLHGDYYPGSWMTTKNNIYIIDPEFSFRGFAEFDLGVLAGHLLISTIEKSILNQIQEKYPRTLDLNLLEQMTGIEVMRRLIGLAQLPLKHTLSEKKKLLEIAYNLIIK